MISGLGDDDIKREVLGWAELDQKKVQDTVTFVEAKEMARDALSKQSVGAVSTYEGSEHSRIEGNDEV